jgi:hypothetical protein
LNFLTNENNRLNNLVAQQQIFIENQKKFPTNNMNTSYSSNKDLIIELYKKIEELKLKLSRYPYDLSQGEKLISVIFTSTDQKIHQSIICKNTEKFSRLEEILYKESPKHFDSNTYFCVKGRKVNRYKTLKENNIHDSDVIILNKSEF